MDNVSVMRFAWTSTQTACAMGGVNVSVIKWGRLATVSQASVENIAKMLSKAIKTMKLAKDLHPAF